MVFANAEQSRWRQSWFSSEKHLYKKWATAFELKWESFVYFRKTAWIWVPKHPSEHIIHSSFFPHAGLFQHTEEAEVLKRSVCTSNYPCRNFLFYGNSHFGWKMHPLINTSELEGYWCVYSLRCCSCVSSAARQQEKWRKLCSPLTISISSVWIPSELNPWPLPLSPSRAHADLWPLPRLWGPGYRPQTPTSQEKKNTRRKVASHC